MFGRRQHYTWMGKAINISKEEEDAVRVAMQEIRRDASDLEWVIIQLRDLESRVHNAEALLLEEKRKADSGQKIDEGHAKLILNTLEVNKEHLDIVLTHLKKDSKLTKHIRNLVDKADHFATVARKLMQDNGINPDIVGRSL